MRIASALAAVAAVFVAAVACAQGGQQGPSTPGRARVSASRAPRDPALRAVLDAHNRRRAEHCAPPLEWSDELARVAQGWADELSRRGCAFEHNDTPFGENLAAGTAGRFAPGELVELWYRERARYDWRAARFSMQSGHFTQLVWRESRFVGCGTSTCGGRDLWVCNYDPPGNVQGAFRENVLPTSCARARRSR